MQKIASKLALSAIAAAFAASTSFAQQEPAPAAPAAAPDAYAAGDVETSRCSPLGRRA